MNLSARDALAVLHEAGIDPASCPALAWLLVAVGELTPEQVAAALGIERDSVRVYLWRVNRRIRQHDEAHALALAEADLPPDPDAPREELQAAARALLDAVANRPAPPDHAADARRPPLLPLCPEDVRVMAWVKPFAVFRPNVNPAYAWEPVLVRGGRPRGRDVPTVRDWLAAPITLQRGCPGAKPAEFCHWLFEVLNLQPGDELHDLFPGSGGVGAAWAARQRQGGLFQDAVRAHQDDPERVLAPSLALGATDEDRSNS